MVSTPRTTLESARRFRRVNPELPILGVEIDKERVEAALPYADERPSSGWAASTCRCCRGSACG